ncbi:MAG: flavin-containing monooxygenase [Ktedonobacterales bacterium]
MAMDHSAGGQIGGSVAIVGAGAAGLATAASLRQYDIHATIYETGDGPATTWRTLYDRLHLHTVKGLSGLPGMAMPVAFPRYPSRQQVVDYLAAYAKRFELEIVPHSPVLRARPDENGWRLTTPHGEYRAEVLVSATGIFSNPHAVTFPALEDFEGRIMLAAAYRNAAAFVGQRVLIVGAGNTGAEIALDLAEHGITPTVAIRAGAHVVPRELLGVPIQRWAHVISRLPRGVTSTLAPVLLKRSERRQAAAGVPKPAGSVLDKPGVPIIGLEFLQYAREGIIRIAGAIERFTDTGVRFADGREEALDVVVLATGYRPALGYLEGVVSLDAAGFPVLDDLRASGIPNLYFVGMHYDLLGTLYNIAHEAPAVAAEIARHWKQAGG